MLLVNVVDVSAEVAGTRSRNAKVRALAGLLAELGHAEVRPATAFLAGELPGGRAGVGWSTLSGLDVAAAPQPRLTVAEVDAVIDDLHRDRKSVV